MSSAPFAKSNSVGVAVVPALGTLSADSEALESQGQIVDTLQQPACEGGDFTAPQTSNYFLRHWRGDLSLGVSYWVNGFLVVLVFAAIIGFITAMNQTASLKTTAAAGILLYALILAATVWQLVGIWRSASKHTSRGGRQCWATLAKLAVIIGVLRTVGFTVKTIVPQSVELTSIILGDTGIPAYTIRVLPDGNEIEFSGGIRAGAASALQKILDAVPQAKVLQIESVGGRVYEAEKMAALVRKHGLMTYTSKDCLSAATLVLIAGNERVVEARAKVGFHRTSLPGMTENQRRAADENTRETMRRAGVSDEFINHVLATAPESIWYPSIAEMKRAGVITSESFGGPFAAESPTRQTGTINVQVVGYGIIKFPDSMTTDQIKSALAKKFPRTAGKHAQRVQTDSARLLTKITTRDGVTYGGVTVQRVDADGLAVAFRPPGGGIGVAKIKFENLPDSLQKRFAYDPDKAAQYEAEQRQAAAQWRAEQQAQDAEAKAKRSAQEAVDAFAATIRDSYQGDTATANSVPSVNAGSGHWIRSVLDDGSIIKMEDGSLWQVSPLDTIDSALWLPVSSITVTAGDDAQYPYLLINTDDNEMVSAKRVQ